MDWITIEIDDPRELAAILTDARIPGDEIPRRDEILSALRFKDAYELGELTASMRALNWPADCLAMEVDRTKPFLDSPHRNHPYHPDVERRSASVWGQH